VHLGALSAAVAVMRVFGSGQRMSIAERPKLPQKLQTTLQIP